VLTHVFYGKTLEDAKHVFSAHMRTDSFMRGCVLEKRFRDFACHTESHIEHANARGEWTVSGPYLFGS